MTATQLPAKPTPRAVRRLVTARRTGQGARLCLRVPAHPSQSRPLRARLGATLHRWGLSELADTAPLALTELFANALRHGQARTLVTVVLARDSDGLRVEVHDPNPAPPVLRGPTEDRPGGRGLALVAASASALSWHPLPTGKAVWCLLASGGRP